DHGSPSGSRFEVAPWVMWSGFRSRRNYTGNIYSSMLDPTLAGVMGDLWEMVNWETSLGATSRFHAAPVRISSWLEATAEPGVYIRSGHSDQTQRFLSPDTLAVWDRRLDAGIDTLDTGAYFDADLRAFRKVR